MLRMASRLTFGPVMNDFQEGINVPRMREERAAKAKQVMKQSGVPAILVTGASNVRYLVGFNWIEFQPGLCYALFFAEHDPVVFALAGLYHQAQDQTPWIKQWRLTRSWFSDGLPGTEATQMEAKLFAEDIRNELQERGLTAEKLGIVGFDEAAREALRNAGLHLVEGFPLLLEASKTKTEDEINCLKMAASFCSTGWQRVIEVCKRGMSEGTLHRLVRQAIEEAGAEHAGGGPISGPFTYERNATYNNRRLENGDLLYYPLCGTSYMGYTACLYRCFKVGQRPSQKEAGWYNKMKDRLDRAIEATKIGNTTADAAKAGFPPASTWGYKSELEVLTVEMGHGIGIVSLHPFNVTYNLPMVNRLWSLDHPMPFEKGMVIAYEALEGETRVGGTRIEDMVVITENGAEVIDYFPRDEIITVGI